MDPKLFCTRYRPYLAIIAAVIALVWFLPGGADDAEQASAGGSLVTTPSGAATPGGATPIESGDGTAVTTPGGAPAARQNGAPGQPGQTGAANEAVGVPEGAGADCDTNTGRIKVPTIAAPPCVPPFSGDNGGSTYQGVTADTIKVVYFQAESDPAVDAALTAAGANNTPEERKATMDDYVDYFNHHYELYGRKVELIHRAGSGDTEDDAVGRADALAIATEDKAFAV